MSALEAFAAAEANLVKLERLWDEMQSLMPGGLTFGSDPEYEDRSRAYGLLLASLPQIGGWKPEAEPPDLNELAQGRLDAMEVGEMYAHVAVEEWAEAPARELREYRFRLNSKRRALIRDALVELIDAIDDDVRTLLAASGPLEENHKLEPSAWASLREHVNAIEVLLGSSVEKPARWDMLRRHLSFADRGDLRDIELMDWPQAKAALRKGLYGANEPIPVPVADLDALVAAKPRGPVTSQLAWGNLEDLGFERLLFGLIADTPGYENPEWLMKTRAPDRGRDLSVTRVSTDSLAGTLRSRVVIQCKHLQSRSLSLDDVAATHAQMDLWRDPRVDVLVFATSGRFTADAVQWIETQNGKSAGPRIEMWPESHLERLLASRPALVAEFGLR
jgi:hypothetical protein